MIKKSYLSAVFLTVFFMTGTLLFAQEEVAAPEDSLSSFQILGSMSLGYAANSDMSKLAKDSGQDDANNYNSIVPGDPFKADNTSADFTYGFDAELRYFFGNFGLGVEIGYHAAKAKSEVSGSGWVDKANTTVDLTVVPVVGTIFYRFPVEASKSFLLVGAGLGSYSGKIEFKWDDKDTIPGNDSFTVKGKQSTIGYHALVEYDIVMDSGLTLFAGVKARYVKFDKFKDGSIVVTNYAGDKNLEAGLTGVNVYLGAGLSI